MFAYCYFYQLSKSHWLLVLFYITIDGNWVISGKEISLQMVRVHKTLAWSVIAEIGSSAACVFLLCSWGVTKFQSVGGPTFAKFANNLQLCSGCPEEPCHSRSCAYGCAAYSNLIYLFSIYLLIDRYGGVLRRRVAVSWNWKTTASSREYLSVTLRVHSFSRMRLITSVQEQCRCSRQGSALP